MAWTLDYASGVLTTKFKDRVLEEIRDDLKGGCVLLFECGSSIHLASSREGIQVTEFSDHQFFTHEEQAQAEIERFTEKVDDLECDLKRKTRACDALEAELATIRNFLRGVLAPVQDKKALEEILHG